MSESFTYLWINIFTLLFPFVFSFEKRALFYKKWKPVFISILLSGIFFIIWDSIFTAKGVWFFNAKFLTGIKIVNLPLEEVLFFITVPYASFFVYEAVKFYFPSSLPERLSRFLLFAILGFLVILSISNYEKLYTLFVSVFLTVLLIICLNILNFKILGHAIISYTFLLIPFFIVNGLLTGSFINRPVVLYNNNENLGIRILTIPVEDAIYSLLMLLLSILIYEKLGFNRKSSVSS